jgi:hypothetical protein
VPLEGGDQVVAQLATGAGDEHPHRLRPRP